jgi:cell division protein ZapA (FtsZ GTPase activity inhibitor)
LFLPFQSFPMKEKNMYINEYILMAFAFLLVMTPVVVMLVLAEEERRHEAYARQLQRQIFDLRQRNDRLKVSLEAAEVELDRIAVKWDDACAEMWVQASQKAEAKVEAEMASLRQRLHGYDLDMAGMSAMLEQTRADQGDRDQRILDVASAFHEA